MQALHSLKQLETLVKQAAESMQKLGAENRHLKDALRLLEAENKTLKMRFQEARLRLARHERLKPRLRRLNDKLARFAS